MAVSTTATEQARPSRALLREIGLVGLLWASMGSIIGSGWLFGAQKGLMTAGPAAIISWVIGGAAILVLALVHAELGAMYPVSGGSARFPHYAFGGFAGASFGWFSWLQCATVAPIEVSAMILYAGHYDFAQGWLHDDGTLTASGLVVAVVLMFLVSSVNYLGIRALALTNSVATWWKVGVPLVDDLPRGHRRRVPHLELHGRQRVQPRRCPRHPGRGLDQRHHLQLPRLRAGRPARRREQQPQARHPLCGDRVDPPGPGHLHRTAGRRSSARCRRARSAARWDTVGNGPLHGVHRALGRARAPWSASAGWRGSCTSTRSSPRAAPG